LFRSIGQPEHWPDFISGERLTGCDMLRTGPPFDRYAIV
jgi:hypothetical protein